MRPSPPLPCWLLRTCAAACAHRQHRRQEERDAVQRDTHIEGARALSSPPRKSAALAMGDGAGGWGVARAVLRGCKGLRGWLGEC